MGKGLEPNGVTGKCLQRHHLKGVFSYIGVRFSLRIPPLSDVERQVFADEQVTYAPITVNGNPVSGLRRVIHLPLKHVPGALLHAFVPQGTTGGPGSLCRDN